MKTTKKDITEFVRHNLATNKAWALKALVRIFNENQTPDEKATETVRHDNGVGFTGTDGQFLSSLAKQFIATGSLSVKQMSHVFRLMPKYHAQIIRMSNMEKLTAMVADYVYTSNCETQEAIKNEIRAHGRD